MADIEGCIKALIKLWSEELSETPELDIAVARILKRAKREACIVGFLRGFVSVFDITGATYKNTQRKIDKVIESKNEELRAVYDRFWERLREKEEALILEYGFESMDAFLNCIKEKTKDDSVSIEI